MPDTAHVTFTCKKCGTQLTWPDTATDDTELFCQDCGERFGTYADLGEEAMRAVGDRVETIIKDALKNIR